MLDEFARLTAEEQARTDAWHSGYKASSAYLNPHWRNWPKPAPGGSREEVLARLWVDGYVGWLKDNRILLLTS